MLQMVDFLIVEPDFYAKASRFYSLPFKACEVFCSKLKHMEEMLFGDENYEVMDRLMSFLRKNSPFNTTLGGYFNKIMSFWLLKDTQRVFILLIL